ncbi:hypothetical protein N8446_02155 [Planktomarina temperata]|nr:hypothetical protein [Planktomarina temperata]
MDMKLLLAFFWLFSFHLIGLASTAFAQSGRYFVSQNKDWTAGAHEDACWATTKSKKSIYSLNSKLVQMKRDRPSIGASLRRNKDGNLSFYYFPGFPTNPSEDVKMYVDGQLFYLKSNNRHNNVVPKTEQQNRQILSALAKGIQAEIVSTSMRGTKVNDKFSLMGFTASARASYNECQTQLAKQLNTDTKAVTSNQKRATGGGEVRVMEVVATNRKSRGKLDACEISYILAFEDYIYLDGGITFLRGSLSLAGFTNDADREPAFLFKVTAFDLLAEGHKLAPLEYAYLSTDNISYAGKESTIIDASDGGLVVAYDVSNSSLNFIEPLTLNIMRKDGRSDVAVPVNFMEADLNAGVSYAACMLNLLEVLTNKFN